MRLLIASALLLAGCAAPGGPRFVVLESESYGCGAAEGLGCGLAIDPVLRSIDELEGVAESSTSWDGRFFRIEVRPGADPDGVAAAAAALLEGEACCVTEPRGKADPAQPDAWFNTEQVVELSRHEAGVIAADFASEIGAEVELERTASERLHTVLREELTHAFEQAHASGGGVQRLWEQLPAAWPRFEARIAEFLTPAQCEQVSAIMARELEE
jgi:hypothetical protein